VDSDRILAIDSVEKVIHVQEPYKIANRLFHPEDSVVQIGNRKIGGENFAVIAVRVPWKVKIKSPVSRKMSNKRGRLLKRGSIQTPPRRTVSRV
jgi:hypothetical protein